MRVFLFVSLWAAINVAPGHTVQAQPAAPVQGHVQLHSVTEAATLALSRAPALQAADAGRAASHGDQLQARLYPYNPEAGVDLQQFGGSAAYSGFRSQQLTYSLSQRIELAGQRHARIAVANAGSAIAQRDYEAARLDIARDTVAAYATLIAAQRAVNIEAERIKLAAETAQAVRDRVTAGREAPVQIERAEVARSMAGIAMERARRGVQIAEADLAALLMTGSASVPANDPWYDTLGAAPFGSPSGSHGTPDANPNIRRLDDVITEREAALRLERTKQYPDLTVVGGMQRLGNAREDAGGGTSNAFVVGMSIPLPLFNRNQGSILRAQADVTRAELEARSGRRFAAASLSQSNQRLAAAWNAAFTLRQEVLPRAERTLRLMREGYAAGKFALLDVLDAQRTVSDVRTQLNDALLDYQIRRAETARLAGQSVVAVPHE